MERCTSHWRYRVGTGQYIDALTACKRLIGPNAFYDHHSTLQTVEGL